MIVIVTSFYWISQGTNKDYVLLLLILFLIWCCSIININLERLQYSFLFTGFGKMSLILGAVLIPQSIMLFGIVLFDIIQPYKHLGTVLSGALVAEQWFICRWESSHCLVAELEFKWFYGVMRLTVVMNIRARINFGFFWISDY